MPIFKKAFTLIELLVVVSILSTLAGAIIYSTDNAREKGKDARRKEDLKAVSSALVSYYADHGQYPQTVDGELRVLDYASDQDDWIPELDEYLEKQPKDPLKSALPNFWAGMFNRITGRDTSNGNVASAKSDDYFSGGIITGTFSSYNARTETLEIVDYTNGARLSIIAIDKDTKILPNQNENLSKLSLDQGLTIYLEPDKDKKTADYIVVEQLIIPKPNT